MDEIATFEFDGVLCMQLGEWMSAAGVGFLALYTRADPGAVAGRGATGGRPTLPTCERIS